MNEANFLVLLKLSGLRKYQVAERLGFRADTIGRWKNAAPKFAVAYLQLYVDNLAKQKEIYRLRRENTVVRELKAQKTSLKTSVSKLAVLIEKATR